MVVKQREGLVHKPRLMLINEARWWMRAKDEWIAAQREGGPSSIRSNPRRCAGAVECCLARLT
jgi:hypothetical protein